MFYNGELYKSLWRIILSHIFQVHNLHWRGCDEASRIASQKAVTYASWAFIAAVITAVVLGGLAVTGLTLLICFGIDWEKQ